ncbi:ATP-dependent DNA helicase DinG [Paenibacillus flagellatus]|uniref:3'-5' exonuclease DinG n=1 Tax=Paenibacillus flagellatus TaxID=2211139 RepID=A0A2V5K693_9BACL|nr:ATP-dependent DNA helicase DinG [Paenibacillus flagellatus]PYI54881.1 ATP-dependent helicase DinG [Paenibacillus flagellatus]
MKYAVIDFETTGDQPSDDIIQVGLVVIEEGTITRRFASLVKPSKPIPEFIVQLTGITDEMVAEAPAIEDVLSDMLPLLADSALVAHNAGFDHMFLRYACEKSGYLPFDGRVLDTIPVLRMLFPTLTSLQLSMVTQAFGIEHDRPHQADSDAEATALVWLRCLERFDSLPLLTVQKLAQLFENDPGDLGWFLQEMRLRKEIDVGLDPDTHRYFRQYVLNVNDWEQEKPAREDEDGEADSGIGAFEPFYGKIKQNLREKFDIFEEREAQEQMIREVEASFASDRHLMVEAGTGTGKSLGYLIPSLYHGVKENKKVIVSTHTINLQEQLRQRDVPLLQDIFPVPFRAAVLKGRSHYLCLRKFEQKLYNRDFASEKDDRVTAAQMVVWLSETEHGDDEELYFANRGAEFWSTVASDTDSCLNRMCPWYKKCFYHRARHEANIADVVITNHSLLFTDIQAENRLLPAYKQLVIDEAHHFEEVASKHLGMDLHYASMLNTLLWMYKDAKTGQLPSLQFRLDRGAEEKASEWNETIESVYPRIVRIKEEWDKLTELLYLLVSERNDAAGGESGQYVLRLKPESLPKHWEPLLVIEENIYLETSEIAKKLERLVSELKEESDEFTTSSVLTDLSGSVKQLVRQRDILRFFLRMSDPNYVYWIEASPFYKSKSVQLFAVPLDVSQLLKQFFFDTKDSVVLTSATLTVNKSFQYSAAQLGLQPISDETKVKTVQLPSPFQYRRQALVLIPRDFPSVKGATADAAFIDALVGSLADVAVETKGRMLVLFTSHRMLKQIHPELKEKLKPHAIQVLGQGVDSGNRSKLIRLFRSQSASVLLGTSSFWEGVDIPGEALTCLAIVRLPFQPPNHPLVEAKSEQLKKSNLNPFTALSVPQAVIRFKQGFGRLVRTAQDRGVVVIYDTRVLETSYGRNFLYSLPGPKIEHLSTQHLVSRISDWMGGENG